MKTASEIVQELGTQNWNSIKIIQEYGRQCAEQSLKDAAKKQLLGKTTTSIVKEILRTIIQTP